MSGIIFEIAVMALVVMVEALFMDDDGAAAGLLPLLLLGIIFETTEAWLVVMLEPLLVDTVTTSGAVDVGLLLLLLGISFETAVALVVVLDFLLLLVAWGMQFMMLKWKLQED